MRIDTPPEENSCCTSDENLSYIHSPYRAAYVVVRRSTQPFHLRSEGHQIKRTSRRVVHSQVFATVLAYYSLVLGDVLLTQSYSFFGLPGMSLIRDSSKCELAPSGQKS
ncbi:hypothetical protein PISMIDRAFT_275028 [Pisolithus microcarpus 441]|uniref:Uncharacterized protein n=1 Tax=Pisolithus microcarpus 441 TaxID=765257 RepID=A0A0C9ZKC4_9AGAM|nr:hypothetical protein BKA83DRAFT_275028 [Pisolithus microcarpus]KIK26414.1 hypothetical protein PISMIDRAFT_275028 [Pisolithus microcarpus 441]